jgi:hypothetical protein
MSVLLRDVVGRRLFFWIVLSQEDWLALNLDGRCGIHIEA